ncbi:MAG TPA: hypothetical protein PLY56_07515 [Armatimonadota bacterium]|nr:hypothetical protein [Armatimonadota bacterium]
MDLTGVFLGCGIADEDRGGYRLTISAAALAQHVDALQIAASNCPADYVGVVDDFREVITICSEEVGRLIVV